MHDLAGDPVAQQLRELDEGILFWLLLRTILRADRTERREYTKIEAQERAKAGLAPKNPGQKL